MVIMAGPSSLRAGKEFEVEPLPPSLEGKQQIGKGVNGDNNGMEIAFSQGHHGPGHPVRGEDADRIELTFKGP
jgi:hypothetical protein